MENVIAAHITKTPGVSGGRPCIAGHRIRVWDIVVWHEKRGYAPDEIVAMFPGISLADVHAALAYHFDHRDEIEADVRQEEELAQSVKQLFPSKVEQKVGAILDAADRRIDEGKGISHDEFWRVKAWKGNDNSRGSKIE